MIDHELIKRALAEDLQGGEDITSVATVSGTEKVVADFVARRAGVIAGIDMARAVLVEVGLKDISVLVQDGAREQLQECDCLKSTRCVWVAEQITECH